MLITCKQCGYCESLQLLENPKGLFSWINNWLIDWLCVKMCFFRVSAWLNDLMHCSHVCSFAPVWLTMCLFRWLILENDLVHCSHLCIFSVVWGCLLAISIFSTLLAYFFSMTEEKMAHILVHKCPLSLSQNQPFHNMSFSSSEIQLKSEDHTLHLSFIAETWRDKEIEDRTSIIPPAPSVR